MSWHWQLLFCLLFSSSLVYSSVLLSGGPYCTDSGDINTAVHALPGTTISITCSVDNPSPGINALEWTIPSFGVSVSNVNGAIGVDADQPDFVSTVNSFDNTVDTTNATLTFTAVSGLDEDVLSCGDVTSATNSCTIYILSKSSTINHYNHCWSALSLFRSTLSSIDCNVC